MKFDIIVFYSNNNQFLEKTLTSIAGQKTDIKQYNLIIAKSDNMNKIDKKIIEKFKGKFKSFNIISVNSNAKSKILNDTIKEVQTEYALVVDEFQELREDSIQALEEKMQKYDSENVAVFEMRMLPGESEKDYNQLNFETKYFIDSCYCIKKSIFTKIGGFDEKINYIEKNIDISYRLTNAGYKILYIADAVTKNFRVLDPTIDKQERYKYSFINNYYLRCKYGTRKDRKEWRKYYVKKYFFSKEILMSRKVLLKIFIKTYIKALQIFMKRPKKSKIKMDFNFEGYDIVILKNNLYVPIELKEKPLVSILVRTCGRPNVLRETLISLRNQTYKNIEIVIVEDGPNKSQSMIRTEFSDLNIVYEASMKKVGRCVVGNRAMELAKGKYLNFLDDDDLFYNDHVEVMVSELEAHPEYNVAHDFALQTNIRIDSLEPEYKYTVLKKYLYYNRKFNRVFIWVVNSFPTQSIMFKKEVFLECGGFDLEMDHMEDWELWARFSVRNQFLVVNKITSLYRIVPDPSKIGPRQALMVKYTPIAQSKILANKLDGLDVGDFYEDVRKAVNYEDVFF